jgi:peptidyl-prolyl cis-trans isomerase D
MPPAARRPAVIVAKGFFMLDRLRQGAGGPVAKILMGILVISFGIWGVAGRMTNFGVDTLARVGDQRITVADFQRTEQQLQRLAEQTGRQPDPRQVLDQMLLNAALDDEAHNFNLGVSDQHAAAEIARDQSFKGADGTFDENHFQLLLKNAGIDPDHYVTGIKKDLVRQQMTGSIAAGIEVPQPILEALYRYQNEERTVSYVVVDASAITPVGTPDDAALKAYFDANKEKYRAPEYRKLGLLVVDPAKLADPKAVADADVAAEYEKRKASYTRPERRHIQQIHFSGKEAAEAALTKLQGGADFAQVAQENGVSPADLDLGMKSKAEIIDPKVADAAFAAQPNTVVPVLDSSLGPTIVRVTEVEAGSVTPLAEVAPRLKQDLATRAARDHVRTFYDQVEDERAGGATLEEVAKKLSLPYRVVDAVAQDGTAPNGSPVADLPVKDPLLKEAFDSDVGVENNAVRGNDDSFVFYDVLEVTPTRDRALDEVKTAVVGDWAAQETQNRVAEKAEALLGRLQKGEALATIAAEIGKPVQAAEHVKRGDPAGLSAGAAKEAFAGPEGHVGNAESDAPPARILFKVDRVIAPAYFAEAADSKYIKQQFTQALTKDIVESYNRQVLQGRDTRIDNNVFAQITGNNQAQ